MIATKPRITFVFEKIGARGRKTGKESIVNFDLPTKRTELENFFIPQGYALKEVILHKAKRILQVSVSGKKSPRSQNEDQINAELSSWISQRIKLQPSVADSFCVVFTTSNEFDGGANITDTPEELPAYYNFTISFCLKLKPEHTSQS